MYSLVNFKTGYTNKLTHKELTKGLNIHKSGLMFALNTLRDAKIIDWKPVKHGMVYHLLNFINDQATTQRYIKIHRKILESDFYQDNAKIRIWYHLLLNANYSYSLETDLSRGEGFIKINQICQSLDLDFQEVKTSLLFFEKNNMINFKNTKEDNLIIEICNYDKYQGIINDDFKINKDSDKIVDTTPEIDNQNLKKSSINQTETQPKLNRNIYIYRKEKEIKFNINTGGNKIDKFNKKNQKEVIDHILNQYQHNQDKQIVSAISKIFEHKKGYGKNIIDDLEIFVKDFFKMLKIQKKDYHISFDDIMKSLNIIFDKFEQYPTINDVIKIAIDGAYNHINQSTYNNYCFQRANDESFYKLNTKHLQSLIDDFQEIESLKSKNRKEKIIIQDQKEKISFYQKYIEKIKNCGNDYDPVYGNIEEQNESVKKVQKIIQQLENNQRLCLAN